MDLTTIAFIAAAIVICLYIVSIYNKLVTLKNRYVNGFSQIDVQMKRRYDLIPNLVETAKAYMKHEQSTLEAVIAARNQASASLSEASKHPGDAASIKSLNQAESSLANNLGKFNLLVEDYPEIKASQNMMQLSEELTSTENKIAFARQGYNDQVMSYNTYKQSFPQTIFAGMFGHGEDASLLEFEDREAISAAPKVTF